MSFKNLKADELRRSAIEDFAVTIDDDASADDIRAVFLETGITWEMYLAQHPEIAEAEEVAAKAVAEAQAVPQRVPEPSRKGAVVTSGDVTGTTAEEKKINIRVKEEPVLSAQDKYLVKMTRPNTLYETRGYRFTQENPYALVDADDFQYILEVEDGFRQALPSELTDFYK